MDFVSTNVAWNNMSPRVSVITPVFNRRNTIGRAIESVERQTYRNFEYIIINDGSTENIDDIIEAFMERTELPVMYIKKANGGVHTARNRGIRAARGQLLEFIDSDDELTPNALEVLVAAWDSIQDAEKPKYYGVTAWCVNQNGKATTVMFPEYINDLTWKEIRSLRLTGEFHGIQSAKIMKENLWPEPEGITFVSEGVIWARLQRQYKCYFINDVVRIYYTDTVGSYTHPLTRSVQYCKNTQWNLCYQLNHEDFKHKQKSRRLTWLLQYCVFGWVLRLNGLNDVARLERTSHKLLRCIFLLPSYAVAKMYIKQKMR